MRFKHTCSRSHKHRTNRRNGTNLGNGHIPHIHLGGTGEAITALADGDVEHELLDLDLPHRVRLLLLRRLRSQAPKKKPAHIVRTAHARGTNDSVGKEKQN